jgi:hypothetical protein
MKRKKLPPYNFVVAEAGRGVAKNTISLVTPEKYKLTLI